MTQETPVMRMARIAKERVATWSPAKQDYARRAMVRGELTEAGGKDG